MAIPVPISCNTVMTWMTTMVGNSPICHIITGNLPELPEHGATTTSFVDLTATSDVAANYKKIMKDMKDVLLRSEYALPTLFMENQRLQQDKGDALHNFSMEDQHKKQDMEDALCALSTATEQQQQAELLL